jgi:hypothetical protein
MEVMVHSASSLVGINIHSYFITFGSSEMLTGNNSYKRKKLLPSKVFYRRLLFNFGLAMVIIASSLALGVWGYMTFASLNFTDALLNASMILGGMGPVDTLHNNASKYFASFYSLFSGITFLSTVAVLLTPVIHRALHIFHLETEEEEEKEEKSKGKK